MKHKLSELSAIKNAGAPLIEVEEKKWFEPALRKFAKAIAFTKMGEELTVYLKIIDFIRVIAFSIAKNTNIINDLKSWKNIKELSGYDYGILRAFVELGCKAGILDEKDSLIKINEEILSEEYVTGQYIIKNIKQKNLSWLSSKHRREISNFTFIYLLICIRNEEKVDSDILAQFGISDRWINIVNKNSYNYELILCEYVLELLNVNLVGKIKFSKGEEFYTSLGRSAFELFTREYFKKTLDCMNLIGEIKIFLDIGCGYGDYIEIVSKMDTIEKITGVERQTEVYNIVKERFKHYKNIEIINENVFNIELDEKIDLILLNYVLFYFSDADKLELFKKLNKILNDKGHIMICQYYPKTEEIKRNLAIVNKDFDFDKRIGMYLGNIILYSEVLLNETLDDFKQSERWEAFCEIIDKADLEIGYITNAERFYYSYFIMLKKKKS